MGEFLLCIKFCRFLESKICPLLHIRFLVPPRGTPWSLSCLLNLPILDMSKAVKLALLVAGFHLCSAYLLPNEWLIWWFSSSFKVLFLVLLWVWYLSLTNYIVLYLQLWIWSRTSDYAYAKLQICGGSIVYFPCVFNREYSSDLLMEIVKFAAILCYFPKVTTNVWYKIQTTQAWLLCCT